MSHCWTADGATVDPGWLPLLKLHQTIQHRGSTDSISMFYGELCNTLWQSLSAKHYSQSTSWGLESDRKWIWFPAALVLRHVLSLSEFLASNNDLTAAHFGQSLSMGKCLPLGYGPLCLFSCWCLAIQPWLLAGFSFRFFCGEKTIWPHESRSRYDCLMGLEDDWMILIQYCFRLKPPSRDATSWSRSVTRRMGKWLVYFSNREIEWNWRWSTEFREP